MLGLQGARLWDHSDLPVLDSDPDVPDTELEKSLLQNPPRPSLDLEQARAIRSELRLLVPSIHEVIDRALADHRMMLSSISTAEPEIPDYLDGGIPVGEVRDDKESTRQDTLYGVSTSQLGALEPPCSLATVGNS